MSEKTKKLEEALDSLYEASKLAELEGDLLANGDDLPDINNLVVYDYDSDMALIEADSIALVTNLAKLYLNGDQHTLNNDYIKTKILKDAENLADMEFLKKMSKRALLQQLRVIDAGSITPRDMEVFFQGSKEVRDSIKQSSETQFKMESFYKSIRKDLGIQDVPIGDDKMKEDTKKSTSMKDLNDQLEEIKKQIESQTNNS